MSARILMYAKRVLISISIPLILLIFLFLFAGNRVTFSSVVLWLQLAITPAILAWGASFALKVGMWDFSLGGVIYLSGIIGGNIALRMNMELIGVLIFCPLTGAVLGFITGIIFGKIKIPSIVVSVGMLLIYECATEYVFGGSGVMLSNKVYVIYQFPYNVIIGLLAFAVIYYIYNCTTFGYHVRAIGNGISAAKMAGIKINKVRIMCFVFGGLFAGLYAVMNLGSSGVMIPVTNMSSMSVVFEGIICVFIALTLENNCNLAIGVYIGALVVQIIKGGMLALGLPTMYQQCVTAVLLLICMSASTKGRAFFKSLKLKRSASLAANS